MKSLPVFCLMIAAALTSTIASASPYGSTPELVSGKFQIAGSKSFLKSFQLREFGEGYAMSGRLVYGGSGYAFDGVHLTLSPDGVWRSEAGQLVIPYGNGFQECFWPVAVEVHSREATKFDVRIWAPNQIAGVYGDGCHTHPSVGMWTNITANYIKVQ